MKKEAGELRLYLRFDPTVNGNGGGGSGNGGGDSASTDTSTGHTDSRRLRPEHCDERRQSRLRPARLHRPRRALRRGHQRLCRDSERRAHQLDATHALTTSYATASNGNVVQTGRIAGEKQGGDLNFTVALGFGSSQAAAVQTAESALGDTFDNALARLEERLGRLRQAR